MHNNELFKKTQKLLQDHLTHLRLKTYYKSDFEVKTKLQMTIFKEQEHHKDTFRSIRFTKTPCSWTRTCG